MIATQQMKQLLITKISSTPGPLSHNCGIVVQVWTIIAYSQTHLIPLIYEEQTQIYRITSVCT